MCQKKKKNTTSVHVPYVLLLQHYSVYREEDREKSGDSYKNGHRNLSATTKEKRKEMKNYNLTRWNGSYTELLCQYMDEFQPNMI